MKNIIEVEPVEARAWLESHPKWEFCGEVNKISYEEIVDFVEKLHQAGCESITITDYLWEIEPVSEGDEFQPNMLIIQLPVKDKDRKQAFEIINNNFPKFEAKIKYKDTGSRTLWYSFEPEPQKIVVGNKEVTWYS